MKKIDILMIFIGLFLGFLCYFTTNNYLFSGAVLLIFLVDYFGLMRKKFKNYQSLIERVHTSYHFINSFIVTLSVKSSLNDAYENAIRINNAKLNDQTKELEDMTIIDRVKYLKDYFNLSIYRMFLNVIDLYQDQGGNILSIADNLMRECTRTQKTLSDTLAIGNKHLVNFIILWLMAHSILIFMRFSIRDFYQTMLFNPIIPPLIFIYFLVCIISINLFTNSFTNLTIKEESNQ
jgi:hypothetical protein